MLDSIWFGSFLLVGYAYLLFPISVYLAGKISGRRTVRGAYHDPAHVTVIIAVHNEEDRILEKLRNLALLEYQREKLQFIVASDGSTDRTCEIVRSFREREVELIPLAGRGGKERAQRAAIDRAKGQVIVFTDVATMLDKDAIRQIVSNFSDPAIGCVSSEDRVVGEDGNPSGENFYVRYEMWLRRLESKAGSPVGLSGSFFAARKSVCENFSSEMDSDFRTLLNCVKRGLRGTVDPKVIGYYRDLGSQQREFDRKVRTVLRGLTVFFRSTEFLNIFRYGLFSYQLFCHKLLRWLVPLFLIVLFLVNIPLAFGSGFYAATFVLQCLFYGVALSSLRFNLYSSKSLLLKIPVYFVTVNASILVAWFRYFRGQRILLWTPSER